MTRRVDFRLCAGDRRTADRYQITTQLLWEPTVYATSREDRPEGCMAILDYTNFKEYYGAFSTDPATQGKGSPSQSLITMYAELSEDDVALVLFPGGVGGLR